MLRAEKLGKWYGDFCALHEVSFELGPGVIFGLLGPNGAGKTSLIRILNQITAPDKGAVFFDREALQPKHIAQIGYLPEERGLYPKMKVGEQLIYLARLKGFGKSEAHQEVDYWLKRFKIESWFHKPLESLSKGMAQKVQFISTVVHRPKLLILDEPFTGFDPLNAEFIKSEIKHLRDSGTAILLSTHRMESVEELCDEMVLLHRGKVILSGEIEELKNNHHSGRYELLWEGDLPQQWADYVNIISKESKKSLTRLVLELPEDRKVAFLQDFASKSLMAFTRQEASLNDIFIQNVGE